MINREKYMTDTHDEKRSDIFQYNDSEVYVCPQHKELIFNSQL